MKSYSQNHILERGQHSIHRKENFVHMDLVEGFVPHDRGKLHGKGGRYLIKTISMVLKALKM